MSLCAWPGRFLLSLSRDSENLIQLCRAGVERLVFIAVAIQHTPSHRASQRFSFHWARGGKLVRLHKGEVVGERLRSRSCWYAQAVSVAVVVQSLAGQTHELDTSTDRTICSFCGMCNQSSRVLSRQSCCALQAFNSKVLLHLSIFAVS